MSSYISFTPKIPAPSTYSIHRAFRNDPVHLEQLNAIRQRNGLEQFASFPSIGALRKLVAAAIGDDQLDFYQMQAVAHPQESWLECFRSFDDDRSNIEESSSNLSQEKGAKDSGDLEGVTDQDPNNASSPSAADTIKKTNKKSRKNKRRPIAIQTVDELKQFILREGSEYGAHDCFWADSFAQKVTADQLYLTILFVDMERARDCWPYRVLVKGTARRLVSSSDSETSEGSENTSGACCNDDEDFSLRFVVVQRQGRGHFTLMSYQETPSSRRVRAFKASELPPAVSALWGLQIS